MTWGDGSRFEGEWKLDLRFKGRMQMIDGTIYDGEFKDDVYHGRGRILTKMQGKGVDGRELYKVFEGIFEHGKRPTEGKITYSDGTKGEYYGSHVDFMMQGYGYLFIQ